MIHYLRRAVFKCLTVYYRTLFKSYGKNFSFDPHGVYSFSMMSVGNNVILANDLIYSRQFNKQLTC